MNWPDATSSLPVILCAVTGGLLIVLRDRRFKIVLLGLQYVWVFWMTSLSLTPRVALTKLFAGLIACAIIMLGVDLRKNYLDEAEKTEFSVGRNFRMLAVLLVTTGALGLGRNPFLNPYGLEPTALTTALLISGLGLLQMSLTNRSVEIGIGNLSILSGFEIVYSSMEPSLAILAMLAAIHIGISWAVSIIAARKGLQEIGEEEK